MTGPVVGKIEFGPTPVASSVGPRDYATHVLKQCDKHGEHPVFYRASAPGCPACYEAGKWAHCYNACEFDRETARAEAAEDLVAKMAARACDLVGTHGDPGLHAGDWGELWPAIRETWEASRTRKAAQS